MREELVGLVLQAKDNVNCFTVERQDLLKAIEEQRPSDLARSWKKVLENERPRFHFSKTECALAEKVRLKILGPLPKEDGAPENVREAWKDLEVEVDASGFDSNQDGYYVSSVSCILALATHSLAAYLHYQSLSATRAVCTMFLPANICKILA